MCFSGNRLAFILLLCNFKWVCPALTVRWVLPASHLWSGRARGGSDTIGGCQTLQGVISNAINGLCLSPWRREKMLRWILQTWWAKKLWVKVSAGRKPSFNWTSSSWRNIENNKPAFYEILFFQWENPRKLALGTVGLILGAEGVSGRGEQGRVVGSMWQGTSPTSRATM